MNNKGFLLLDSLINICIVVLLCFLCACTYMCIDNYELGYEEYLERTNEKYENVFGSMEECQKCAVTNQEEDSLNQEH